MKLTFETIASEINNVARVIDKLENVSTIDYAVCRLKSIVKQLEDIRMIDLDKREVRTK